MRFPSLRILINLPKAMTLKVLASGSTGNSYLLSTSSEILIVEAGVRLLKVKEAIDFDLRGIVGCLCSHLHRDHSKYIKEYMNAGITLLANKETFESHGVPLDYFRARVIRDGRGYKMGGFKILPFPVVHDVRCHGFIIDHPDSGRILFMTDTYMTEYTFPGLNHIIMEVNFSDDILEKNVTDGFIPPWLRPRLLQTHMELGTAIDIFRANNLSKVRNIILCHLSSGNSDEERFIRDVRETTGKQVYAASRGLEVNFSKEPY